MGPLFLFFPLFFFSFFLFFFPRFFLSLFFHFFFHFLSLFCQIFFNVLSFSFIFFHFLSFIFIFFQMFFHFLSFPHWNIACHDCVLSLRACSTFDQLCPSLAVPPRLGPQRYPACFAFLRNQVFTLQNGFVGPRRSVFALVQCSAHVFICF